MRVVAVLVIATLCLISTVSNDCVGNPSGPYCAPVDNAVPPTLRCRQCQSMCDCAPGEFCVLDHTSSYWDPSEVGTCRPYNYHGILGRQCIPLTQANVVRGQNDQLYCGLVSQWDQFTNRATQVAWEGVCHYGVCQMCEDGPGGMTVCGYNQRVCIGGVYQPYVFSDGTTRTLYGNATGAAATAVTVFFVLFATAWTCVFGIRACMRRQSSEKEPLLSGISGLVGGSSSTHTAASTHEETVVTPSAYGTSPA